MILTVRASGMFTTVQDTGRWGYQAVGMPVAGAMDTMALRAGNLALGNDPNAAALEITVIGPELECSGEGAAVLTGADLGVRLNGSPMPANTVFLVSSGDRISFAGNKGGGARSWICFSGGIDTPPVMGSRSTYIRGGFGGHEGRALRAGDVISCGDPHSLWRRTVGFEIFQGEGVFSAAGGADIIEVRVIEGPQVDMFTREGVRTFLHSSYMVSAESDRMGCRLEGPKIEHEGEADILSDAIANGSIQVPGHGLPIVMLADRQTTGGYTKIATVISADIPLMAQVLPGSRLNFRMVALEEAVTAARKVFDRLERLRILAAEYRARPYLSTAPEPLAGRMRLTFEGRTWNVEWERETQESG